ncbi:Ribonuclease H [Rhizorhabdus wittichii RW1]|uniref:Ribonuclease HII n=1 Tax=Rhizorhabdus wittichii (strain DSM 6014 / CCUG 31198 / JCM 15750 / NBRC 105917 / EY 4224 / RW1) TaxID=392499 RepID=RNH2_RHIWR|nr:RecName: Full=Ribonuclease HII; Short=RNase HII [Rhizorhabdus wittichii RW1]ABQ70912.1 Ribonuclease H [Rhizorhabdus wittichii RW1]
MAGPSFDLEIAHPLPLAGVDEAGRGPLAGPVVAAAVILDRGRVPAGIDDSKKLGAEARADLCGKIREVAHVGVGIATVEEIDEINILWASMLAMERAVAALGVEPAMVLVDGNRCPRWTRPSQWVIGGDALCLSIAAASIVAKEERDRMMADYDVHHPGYGWAKNKGYGTPAHLDALARLGPSPLHRRSFAPVAQFSLFPAA